jgi:hypothetical protein
VRAQGHGHHGREEVGLAYQKKIAAEAGLACQIVRSGHPMQRPRRQEQPEAVWALLREPKVEAACATARQALGVVQQRGALEPQLELLARDEAVPVAASALAGRCHWR